MIQCRPGIKRRGARLLVERLRRGVRFAPAGLLSAAVVSLAATGNNAGPRIIPVGRSEAAAVRGGGPECGYLYLTLVDCGVAGVSHQLTSCPLIAVFRIVQRGTFSEGVFTTKGKTADRTVVCATCCGIQCGIVRAPTEYILGCAVDPGGSWLTPGS